MLFIGLTAGCKMQNAECKIEVFPSEMNKIIYFVRVADTFILHLASCILHFVVANNNLPRLWHGALYKTLGFMV